MYWFGLFPVRSPLLRESNSDKSELFFLFIPLATEMFHFTRSSPYSYVFTVQYVTITRHGFPHSEIPGSKVAWDLPEAYRTLRRPSSLNSV
ncbi:MAG TPA: hypothetical protein DCZ47_01320 [Candidatus Magasanikbacteria bacterium]|nr:hypothetical protein [Candidatus Magasanikbacteria bacterium]